MNVRRVSGCSKMEFRLADPLRIRTEHLLYEPSFMESHERPKEVGFDFRLAEFDVGYSCVHAAHRNFICFTFSGAASPSTQSNAKRDF